MDVLETKPGDAVCVVETDMAVDFAQPADIQEDILRGKHPQQSAPKPVAKPAEPAPQKSAGWMTQDESDDESDDEQPAAAAPSSPWTLSGPRGPAASAAPVPKSFIPFSGAGHRLDGKPPK